MKQAARVAVLVPSTLALPVAAPLGADHTQLPHGSAPAAEAAQPPQGAAPADAMDHAHHDHAAPAKRGTVRFPSSCNAAHLATAGWLAHAECDAAEARRLLRAAADLEDSISKHPVTPGSLLPAREMLANLELDLASQPRHWRSTRRRSGPRRSATTRSPGRCGRRRRWETRGR